MTLNELKLALSMGSELKFKLPNGEFVPAHFHITEIGLVSKEFIDCGGVFRTEKWVSFQLWYSTDFDHRLMPAKFLEIIQLGEQKMPLENNLVEVEYQSETVGRYDLAFDGFVFQLISKQTDCLAPDKCGIPKENKKRIKLSDLAASKTSEGCTPGSKCC